MKSKCIIEKIKYVVKKKRKQAQFFKTKNWGQNNWTNSWIKQPLILSLSFNF